MSGFLKKLPIREICAFFAGLALFVLLLVAVAMIPRASIRQNMQKSADFLCEKNVFFNEIGNLQSSRIDRYADSILLSIAYQYDSNKPLSSVMSSSYYYYKFKNENENLRDSVKDDLPANQEYMRYWHGSISVVRPLHLIMSLKGIYIFNAVFLTMLTALLMFMLIRRKGLVPALGLLAGLILVSAWFVPFSLEYTWVFGLMLIFSALTLWLVWNGKTKWYLTAFLLFGMITNFFDFLTTETLTLTVPLLLFIWAEEEKSTSKESIIKVVKNAVSWGVGYAGAWVAKWGLASLVLHENVMPYITGHVEERLGGELNNVTFTDYLTGSITRNIKCLLPFDFGTIGLFAGVILVIVYFYIAYVYRGEGIDYKKVMLIAVIGLVPYVRYLVLHNHSYLHCFFTYRAQLGTILAMALILFELKVSILQGRRKPNAKRK